MNLDSLISLLILIFFIGLPLLSRLSRRGGRSPSVPSRPPSQPRVMGKRQREIPQQLPADEDFLRRLEEARRRVQEAMNQSGRTEAQPPHPQQSGQTQTPPSPPPPVPSATPAGPIRIPAPLQVPSGPLLQTSVPPPAEREGPEGRSDLPIRRVRRATGQGNEGRNRQISADRQDIINGIIWKQILDRPPWERRGRTPSPRR